MLAEEEEQQQQQSPALSRCEKQLGYTEEDKAHFKRSRYIQKYLSRKATASTRSARTYATHLTAFAFFIFSQYSGREVDRFFDEIKAGNYKTPMTYKLLNSRKDVQLSTAVLFHAVLGPRPIEAFAVRNMDLDLESKVPKVTFRAQYSKVWVECTRYLTKELAGQLKLWLKCKYRKHRVCTKEGRMITVYPEPKPTDLVFAHWHTDESKNPEPKYVYTTTRQKFAELVDTLETG